jgi:hypothetical protein
MNTSTILTVICLIVAPSIAFAQNHSSNPPKIISNMPTHAEWNFIKLEDTNSRIVLADEKQMFVCGHLNNASLTIVKVGSDTIRIIDICNLDEFYTGMTVSISPDNKTQCGVNIPSYVKG